MICGAGLPGLSLARRLVHQGWADGIHSRIRQLVLGPEERYLRQLGLHTAALTSPTP